MDEKKSSKAGLSIGVILAIVFVGFGLLIGLTQLKSTKNLGNTITASPYEDMVLNDRGELVSYVGDKEEVEIPATYSLSSAPVTKTMTDTNLSNLQNKANRLGIDNYNISAKQETVSDGISTSLVTTYTMSFKAYSAIEGDTYTTKRINDYAFQNNQTVKKITLPSTLQRIGNLVFSNCMALEEINLPDSITYIGSNAFANCDSLREITLPASLNYISSGTFTDCQNLQKVDMKDGVTRINSNAFQECNSLSEIIFSKNLQQIEIHAFWYCYALKEVDLPESISYISHMAFYQCNALNKVIIRATSVPSGDSSMFYPSSNVKIYVIDDLVNTYKTASYWSSYASRIYALSTLEAEATVDV